MVTNCSVTRARHQLVAIFPIELAALKKAGETDDQHQQRRHHADQRQKPKKRSSPLQAVGDAAGLTWLYSSGGLSASPGSGPLLASLDCDQALMDRAEATRHDRPQNWSTLGRETLRMLRLLAAGLACLIVTAPAAPAIEGNDPGLWVEEWPETDFDQTTISFDEIKDGGPPKDGIPPIDDPVFSRAVEVDMPDIEPVIGVIIDGNARAYPIRLLIWHEIVNDQIGNTPIAVTFCPLCNTGIVFNRRRGDAVFDFGTTGKLRNSGSRHV